MDFTRFERLLLANMAIGAVIVLIAWLIGWLPVKTAPPARRDHDRPDYTDTETITNDVAARPIAVRSTTARPLPAHSTTASHLTASEKALIAEMQTISSRLDTPHAKHAWRVALRLYNKGYVSCTGEYDYLFQPRTKPIGKTLQHLWFFTSGWGLACPPTADETLLFWRVQRASLLPDSGPVSWMGCRRRGACSSEQLGDCYREWFHITSATLSDDVMHAGFRLIFHVFDDVAADNRADRDADRERELYSWYNHNREETVGDYHLTAEIKDFYSDEPDESECSLMLLFEWTGPKG